MDKLSYALGLSMGNNFKSSGIQTISVADFANGVKAVYEGVNPEMTYDEAKQVINDFFAQMQQEMNDRNGAEGETFLAENGKKSGVVTLPSGLQYEVLTEGKGKKPSATDRVQCHYHGMLINGEVFDSSVERGEPAVFGVSQVIPGWVEALQLMSEGSKWRLFIPSDLAYGENGAGGKIGPNATLIFDVELLKVL